MVFEISVGMNNLKELKLANFSKPKPRIAHIGCIISKFVNFVLCKYFSWRMILILDNTFRLQVLEVVGVKEVVSVVPRNGDFVDDLKCFLF